MFFIDEEIAPILAIILRGTARDEFKELQKFKEADALLLIREDLGSESDQTADEPGDWFLVEMLICCILELLQLLELLFICGLRLKPATKSQACLASKVHHGLSPNSQETSDLMIVQG